MNIIEKYLAETDITSIYTNGAHLVPMKIRDTWMWIVAEFEDDCFVDGNMILPKETAETLNELLDYYIKEK